MCVQELHAHVQTRMPQTCISHEEYSVSATNQTGDAVPKSFILFGLVEQAMITHYRLGFDLLPAL